MSEASKIDQLDDTTSIRILNYLNAELRESITEDQKKIIQNEQDARNALAEVLAINSQLTDIGDARAKQISQSILKAMLQDKEIYTNVMELVENPPEDTQASVETVVA